MVDGRLDHVERSHVKYSNLACFAHWWEAGLYKTGVLRKFAGFNGNKVTKCPGLGPSFCGCFLPHSHSIAPSMSETHKLARA